MKGTQTRARRVTQGSRLAARSTCCAGLRARGNPSVPALSSLEFHGRGSTAPTVSGELPSVSPVHIGRRIVRLAVAEPASLPRPKSRSLAGCGAGFR
jgi:hypothetical protein